MSRRIGHIAVDQHGNFIMLREHPRKELMEYFGRKHIAKMYTDGPNGPRHIGYVVAGRWCVVYEVRRWDRAGTQPAAK